MKRLLAVLSVAALGGCAVAPPGPAYYASRAPQQAFDPYQWHVVSSTPVGATLVSSASQVSYSSAPVYTYSSQPVYAPQTVYVTQPVYAPQPYYYTPPVTIGLDFMFGWGGRRHGGWGHGGWGHGYRGRR